MRNINRLPGRHDGAEGLLELAKAFGDAQVFDLIMLCRTAKGAGNDPGGEALTIIGNRLVDKHKANHPDATEIDAKQAAAKALGFHDSGSRSNFYKILTGGRRRRTASREQD